MPITTRHGGGQILHGARQWLNGSRTLFGHMSPMVTSRVGAPKENR